MIVWSVQPKGALDSIRERGYFRCEKQMSYNLTKPASLTRAYDWLVGRMSDRIGPPPSGVEYPIWAWHTWDFRRVSPDTDSPAFLKRSEPKVLLTLDIPESELVLSDFDAWQNVMNDTLVAAVTTEEEYDRLEERLDALSIEELREEITRSWENVFLTDRVDNGLVMRGRYIQATFWEIRREHVVDYTILEPNI